VHLSPDAPAVTPLFNGDSLPELTEISFASSTDYASLSVADGVLDITTDGTAATSVLDAPLALEDGKSYTAVALGRAAELQAIVFEDDASDLAASDIRVRVIHGAPDVGQVDLFRVASDGAASPLLSDLDFGVAAEPL